MVGREQPGVIDTLYLCKGWNFPEGGLEPVMFIRQCISPTCYSILYAPDLLEDGEIDVRLNSFKGCFHQQLETRKSY